MKPAMEKTIKWGKYALFSLFALIIIMIIAFTSYNNFKFSDSDPYRGANLKADDRVTKLYPSPDFPDWQQNQNWQGWSVEQSMWFYNTTQGSNLMDYDLFMEVQQIDSDALFRADANVEHYKYIAQTATKSNPEALPLGFVKDTYRSKDYIGFTCAACHTAQINYGDVAIRIDGGPAMSDMDRFIVDLQKALENTYTTPTKLSDFAQRVIKRGNYDSEAEVKSALLDATTNLKLYNTINHSKLEYGHARLDAFGRIYNRVLQHVLSRDKLEMVLNRHLPSEIVQQVMADVKGDIVGQKQMDSAFLNLERLMSEAKQSSDFGTLRTLLRIRDDIFIKAEAPVSYPFLWDIAQHDFVQWNGVVANAGVGPLGRNTGEVMGVFATLDWYEYDEKPSWLRRKIDSLVGGQANGHFINFANSADMQNLKELEQQIFDLNSPKWPETVLGKLDQAKITAGKKHYDKYCLSCHAVFDDTTDPNRRVIAVMNALDTVKTDDKAAVDAVAATGYSGILENNYTSSSAGQVLLEERMPVAAILTSATKNVVATPDDEGSKVVAFIQWARNLIASASDNPIEATIKRGDYEPATTAQPWQDLFAYKGRPLNGIWATAPYLHNGSVPTLYDLLLPKKQVGDPEDGEYRPDSFYVGSRELDAQKVGFVSDDQQGSEFLTHLYGNGNQGHEYAAGRTPQADGTMLPALNPTQRAELLEYLKSL